MEKAQSSISFPEELGQFRHSVQNVVIFISDALRWDHTPEAVSEQGVTFKTVASSLYTAPSLPSIITGLYPTKHQVLSWQDMLPQNIGGMLNIKGFNFSFSIATAWSRDEGASHMHRILRQNPGPTLKEIDTPFIFVQHDMGGHCPYGFSLEEYGADCISFFREYGAKAPEELRRKYREGISQSVQRFRRLLNMLRERKLLEHTLVIFTSDHGELLGEYGGLIGHGIPACPELVYVPTTFIHPELPSSAIVEGGVLRSVDLWPTVAWILDEELPHRVDGVNFIEDGRLPTLGYNHLSKGHIPSGNFYKDALRSLIGEYAASSVWDEHGGHVFHSRPMLRNLVTASYEVALKRKGIISTYMRYRSSRLRDYWTALKACSRPHIQYGNSCVTRDEAQNVIYRIENEIFEAQRDFAPMSDEVRRRLEDLGYID